LAALSPEVIDNVAFLSLHYRSVHFQCILQERHGQAVDVTTLALSAVQVGCSHHQGIKHWGGKLVLELTLSVFFMSSFLKCQKRKNKVDVDDILNRKFQKHDQGGITQTIFSVTATDKFFKNHEKLFHKRIKCANSRPYVIFCDDKRFAYRLLCVEPHAWVFR